MWGVGKGYLAAMSDRTATASMGITALIPCYNEIDCVDLVYQQVSAELDGYLDVEVLFVDDGSTDGTLERIKSFAADDPRVHYLSFARNFGQEAAFSAGFAYAGKPWTVQLDADLQSPPAAMHALIERAAQGYDVVFGVRGSRRDGLVRRIGGTAHQSIARRLLGIEMPAGASTFRVARTSVARKIVELRLGIPYFIASVPRVGARYTTVVTEHQVRQGGRGKWSLRKLFGHATDLFVGFSFRPLALVYALAPLAVLTAVAVLVLAGAGLVGGVTVAGAALAVSAAALVANALIARYLVRVIRTQPGLPRYLIREANIPIRPADSLYEYELPPARVPHSARDARMATVA